jgi:hypothetical protein
MMHPEFLPQAAKSSNDLAFIRVAKTGAMPVVRKYEMSTFQRHVLSG